MSDLDYSGWCAVSQQETHISVTNDEEVNRRQEPANSVDYEET